MPSLQRDQPQRGRRRDWDSRHSPGIRALPEAPGTSQDFTPPLKHGIKSNSMVWDRYHPPRSGVTGHNKDKPSVTQRPGAVLVLEELRELI